MKPDILLTVGLLLTGCATTPSAVREAPPDLHYYRYGYHPPNHYGYRHGHGYRLHHSYHFRFRH